jgi:hypothetical protein
MNKSCSRCQQVIEVASIDFGNTIPEYGLHLKICGYYCGFNDNTFEDDEEKYIWICHDCAAKLFRSIPELKNQTGLHPNMNTDGTWCCEFAWMVDPDDDDEILTPPKPS